MPIVKSAKHEEQEDEDYEPSPLETAIEEALREMFRNLAGTQGWGVSRVSINPDDVVIEAFTGGFLVTSRGSL